MRKSQEALDDLRSLTAYAWCIGCTTHIAKEAKLRGRLPFVPRGAFLEITGLTNDGLKGLVRRGIGPFAWMQGKQANAYSVYDCIFAVALQQMKDGGVEQKAAAKVLELGLRRSIELDLRDKKPRQEPIFLGAIKFGDHLSAPDWAPVGGLIHELVVFPRVPGGEEEIDGMDAKQSIRSARQLSLINVTKIIKDVTDTAQLHGIKVTREQLREEFA